MAKVTLNHVYKIYPGEKGSHVTAVEDVNLEIADREFVVLVGPSGCGKSTTLRMIAGLEEISRGDIYIGDRRVNDVAPKDRDIAMVFQNYALYPHMSVFDNMAFGLKLRNNGKVQQIDTPLKLYNEPDNLFVAGFLGSPPMNFINGELKQERGAIVFKETQGGTIEARFDDRPQVHEFLGKPMLLGIRPEDIELAQFPKTGNAA